MWVLSTFLEMCVRSPDVAPLFLTVSERGIPVWTNGNSLGATVGTGPMGSTIIVVVVVVSAAWPAGLFR